VIGSCLGLVFGLLMGLFSVFRAVGMPMVSALYPIPKIALLPLLILWMGIGESPKIATIASGVFFPTVIATFSGVDSVPRNLIRMAQSFNIPVSGIIWKIILPSSLPGILAGFRISVSTALLLVVSAEMIGAQFGVGAFLLTAGNLMQTDDLMAGVVILSILGLSFGTALSMLEKSFLSWR
jgi:NitT/TauT family transport system permease protein